jgi:hypothetical protein
MGRACSTKREKRNLSIYGSTELADLGRFFIFLNYRPLVGFLGRRSARRKAAIYTE